MAKRQKKWVKKKTKYSNYCVHLLPQWELAYPGKNCKAPAFSPGGAWKILNTGKIHQLLKQENFEKKILDTGKINQLLKQQTF